MPFECKPFIRPTSAYQRVFDALDTKKDGALRAGELGPKALAALDENGDGGVSVDEYAHYHNRLELGLDQAGATHGNYCSVSPGREVPMVQPFYTLINEEGALVSSIEAKKELDERRTVGNFVLDVGAGILTGLMFPLKAIGAGVLACLGEPVAAYEFLHPRLQQRHHLVSRAESIEVERAATRARWERMVEVAPPSTLPALERPR